MSTIYTAQKASFNGYSKLCIDWQGFSRASDWGMDMFWVGIGNYQNLGWSQGDAKTFPPGTSSSAPATISRKETEIDVSTLAGEYYITLGAMRGAEITIYNIWLEK